MNWQVIKIRIAKISFYVLASVLFVLLSSYITLQIPAVQNKLAGTYAEKLSRLTGFTISTESFDFIWYDRLEIKGLVILDPEQNTLIESKRILINFRFRTLLQKGDINIDAISLDETDVSIHKIQTSDSSSDLNINLLIAKINEQFGGGDSGKTPQINIGEVVISNSMFRYDDHSLDAISTQFNPHKFGVALGQGLLQNFKVLSDTIQFDLHSLEAIEENTNLQIHQFTTFFRLSQSAMEFMQLDLQVGNSIIKDTLIFKFNSQGDLSDFTNRVSFNAHLEGTKISPKDLALFVPQIKSINPDIYLRGRINGKVSRFQYRDMDIALGNSRLSGSLDMDGLPYLEETFINLKLSNSRVDIQDLSFLFNEQVMKIIAPLGQFQMNGLFTGFVNDFVARGDFEGKIGKINSDINLKIDEGNLNESSYTGHIALTNFDLGYYFNDSIAFQKVTLRGKVNGKGFSLKTLDIDIDGTVESIGFHGYPYTNIVTDARVAQQLFSGRIAINDPNLKFRADGTLDFRGNTEKISMKASLDTAHLTNLGLIKDHLFIRSNAEINSTGLQLDSILGDGLFRDTYVEYKDEVLILDSLQINSHILDNVKILNIESSLMDLSLEGSYQYSDLFKDVPDFFHELYLNLQNKKNAVRSYYAGKGKVNKTYEARFALVLQDVNPILDILDIPAIVSKNVEIRGRYSSGSTSIFRAATSISEIEFDGKKFLGNELEFTGSKLSDSTDVLSILTVTSNKQLIAKQLTTKNLRIESVWSGPQMDANLAVAQDGFDNVLRIQTYIDFLNDSTYIKLATQQMKILGKEWTVDPDNFIIQKGKEWDIHGLKFTHEDQMINLNGYISDNPEKELQLDVSNLSLAFLDAISEENFMGILNGSVKTRNLYHDPYYQNDFTVTTLKVNNFLIGDVKGINNWSKQKDLFDIRLLIDRLGVNTFDISGTFDPYVPSDPLALTATLKQANLKILEPVLKDIFSTLSGDVTGTFSINGTFGKPRITGLGKVEKGTVLIDYLKTLYSFEGNLELNPNMFVLNNFKLTDASNNQAALEGFIVHRNFSTFRISIDADFKNFQILNTTVNDNNLFYGQANATGKLNIFGPANNLKISASARTEKNTRLFIPVSNSESTEIKDFISFVNFTDTARYKPVETTSHKGELSGITMDLNLDITPDAYAEIIFDIKAGDIIRGRGKGDLKLQLNTHGEFNMFGLIEFTEAAYNFTLYDILNKEFNVRPGSRITWFGDPYLGVLDLTASYRQLASMGPIMADQTLADDPQLRRKYPVEVLLNLKGPMLSPEIEFDIEAKDLPDNIAVEGKPPVRLNFEFASFKTRIDEQELKRQVFSLIILRRFSPPESFSTSGTIAGSVSELLSNQLSYWLSQVDENFEIDLDLGSLDPEAYNTFQLRLSYSFFNGRLRVTRDGSYSNQYRSDLAAIGDWTVDYLLTPDGKFRIKMFNRTNVNSLTTSVGVQNPMTTGFSLFHTQNFNDINELVGRARERKKEEEAIE